MTLPAFTPRPPETDSEELVETGKGGRVTGRRIVTSVVRWLWPCSACGETAVVDVEGRCRPCWRALVLAPSGAALDEALALMEGVPCRSVPTRPWDPCAWCLFLARHGRGPLSHADHETTGGTP